ncbi:hypothetical protein [Halohasta salina]|uniref:hypothetical protein n=1 Tax=Halohasta salina TaxID=2961621 RepID=UPI0020A29B96|nr:hypothetical protein [Halohasta salina]
MQRRTYLGLAATGVVGGLAGCTSASDGREFPPYPDSETIERSGDGPGVSEAFEITGGGPTLIDMEHDGADNFTVTLDRADSVDEDSADNATDTEDGDSEPTDNESVTGNTSKTGNATVTAGETVDEGEASEGPNPVTTVATAVGPYDGRSLQLIETGEYVLRIREADASWSATIYDLPVYEDGVGTEPPIEREGDQYDVIGPIDFGEQSSTEFSFSVSGEGFHRVFLTDREGEESLTVVNLDGEGEETVSQQIAGVGYVEILSFGSWSFELST